MKRRSSVLFPIKHENMAARRDLPEFLYQVQ